MRTLVVATTNGGKLRELRAMLPRQAFDVRAIDEVLAQPPRVIEDGATFTENAIKKARAAALATGLLALADDSGLVVDALGGRPGTRSARFAHERATDDENNAALLAELGRSGAAPPYTARFCCVLAVIDPETASGSHATEYTAEGTCEGSIILDARGHHGFGYDSLFVVSGTNKTMAQLTADEKNRVSHRARALAGLRALPLFR